MTSKNNLDYVNVIYNTKDKPITSYPGKLTRYLFNRYNLKKGQSLLDVGCGRGDFLKGFIDCGLNGYAVDQSDTVLKYIPELNFKYSNIEEDGIPFSDQMFDIVYSKSVIEHFYYPEKLMKEIYRVLKPGGIVITLCPSWEYNYKTYFEDFTHRTPFMLTSLRDIQIMSGFSEVNVEYFIQLPIVWKRKWLIPFSKLTNYWAPDFLKDSFKWVKWSKEVMLLSTSYKQV